MFRRSILFLSAVVFLALLGAALLIPAAPASPRPTPARVPAEEHAATVAAMAPPKRERPVIAVLAQNEGTETTDFLIPYAVLAEADAADVIAVAPRASPVRLTPALTVEAQMTLAAFDRRYPDGADYVAVPKIEDAAHAELVAWIQRQSAGGATIVGICSGALTLSAAGLLADRRATGHWFDLDRLRRENPTFRWVPDRRYVVDRGVVTTTGVSASLPVSLALIEAIAGREHALQVAARLGAGDWNGRHDSGAFRLERHTLGAAVINRWLRPDEVHVIPVEPGIDEIALGFSADAWSRSRRSQALTAALNRAAVRTRRGLNVLPDLSAATVPAGSVAAQAPAAEQPARALEASLAGIAKRYGVDTAAFVALQLELAWPSAP